MKIKNNDKNKILFYVMYTRIEMFPSTPDSPTNLIFTCRNSKHFSLIYVFIIVIV